MKKLFFALIVGILVSIPFTAYADDKDYDESTIDIGADRQLYNSVATADNGVQATVGIFYAEDFNKHGSTYITGSSCQFVIVNPGNDPITYNVPVTQTEVQLGGDRKMTRYETDVNYMAYLKTNDYDNYLILSQALQGQTPGGYIEATENFAMTQDGSATLSAYSYLDPNTGKCKLISDIGIGQTTVRDPYGTGEKMLTISQAAQLYLDAQKSGEWAKAGKYMEILSQQKDKFTVFSKTTKIEDFIQMAADLGNKDSALSKDIETRWASFKSLYSKDYGSEEALWEAFKEKGGILCDNTRDYAVNWMNRLGFRDAEDALNHINYVKIGDKVYKIVDSAYTSDRKDGITSEELDKLIEEADPGNVTFIPSHGTSTEGLSGSNGYWDYVANGSITMSYSEIPPQMVPGNGKHGRVFDLEEPIAVTYNDSVRYTGTDNLGFSGTHSGFGNAGGPSGLDSPYDPAQENGIIIPSGEKYLNGITVNTTNGYAALGLAGQTATYDCKYSFRYQQIIKGFWFKEKENPDGTKYKSDEVEERTKNGICWSCNWTKYPGVELTLQRKAYYLYLADLNVKDFDSMTTHNDTSQSGSVTYNSIEDPHTFGDIIPGLERVTNIVPPMTPLSGLPVAPAGRPSYRVKADYKGGKSIDIQPTPLDNPTQGVTQLPLNNGLFTPESSAHLKWEQPSDLGWGNWDLGTFSCHQTAAKYERWDGGTVTEDPPGPDSAVKGAAHSRANWNVGDGKSVTTKLAGHGESDHLATANTDILELPGENYAKKSIFSGQVDPVKYTSDSWDTSFGSGKIPSYLQNTATAIKAAGLAYEGAKTKMIESYETTKALGSRTYSKDQVAIPKEMANGKYPTSIEKVNYKAVLVTSDQADKTTTGQGIKPCYKTNEPIIIQSPVVSPVSILIDNGAETGSTYGEPLMPDDPKAETQLKTEDTSVRQFRLDECYWFKFDPLHHLMTQGYSDITTGKPFDNAWSKNDIKFDKYVSKKEVHFPFDVCIYENGVDANPTYYPHTSNESDPGYWIDITNGTLGDMEYNKFYIPAWAHESDYTSETIRYRVHAINVSKGTGEQEEANNINNPDKAPDKDKYIATYSIKCQVSGWAYNFQVVGTNLRDLYDVNLTPEVEKEWHDLYHSFCPDKEEKKAGTFNRLGGDPWGRYSWANKFVRFTKDGQVTNNWDPKDTIVIAANSSHKYDNPGLAPAGTELAYSFQTMGNFWNPDDWAEIKPTFRYYDPDTHQEYTLDPNSGTDSETHGMLHVYYDDIETGSEVQPLVEYGCNTETSNIHKIKLMDEMFLDSYTDADIDHSANYPIPSYDGDKDIAGFSNSAMDRTQESRSNAFLNKMVDNYTLSWIQIKSGLRVFSGDEGQLKKGLPPIAAYSFVESSGMVEFIMERQKKWCDTRTYSTQVRTSVL